MGGGSANCDVRNVRCLVMFPKESGCYPVPIDGMYLYGIGVRLLKRIGISYLGDSKPFGAIHERDNGTLVSVCTDEALRTELKKNFAIPGETFLLCLVYLDKVRGSIEVRIGHRFFSPEPIEHESNYCGEVPVETTLVEEINSKVDEITQMDDSEETAKCSGDDIIAEQGSISDYPPSTEAEDSVNAGEIHQVVIEKEVEEIFFQRLKLEGDFPQEETSQADITESLISPEIDQGEEYVVLQTPTDAESMPTFFISSSWHLQADRMSASLSTSSASDVTVSGNDAASDLYVVVESEF